MEINAEIIRDFLLRRIDEEIKKDNGSYTILNSDKSSSTSYGLMHSNYIRDAINSFLYKDLKYAFEVDNSVLYPPVEKKLNDYDSVKEAMNHIINHYGAVRIKSIVIIPYSPIKPIRYDNLNLISSRGLYDDLKYKVNKDIDWWVMNNSYYMEYHKDTYTLSIVIHEDYIPAEYIF